MTLKIELIDPENEPPKTLKALAAFLNTMAGVEVLLGEVCNTIVQPMTDSGNERPAAPFASSASTPPAPPAAPAVPATTTADGGDLDVNGPPWDARIHASTKGKNQDGSWKALRGVNKELVPGIEAELRAALGNAALSETPPPPPAVVTASTTAPAGAGDVPPPPPPPVQASGADAPPPPPPPVADAAPEAPTGPTAATVFKLITELKKTNRLPQEQQDMALEMVGLKSLPEFMNLVKTNPELAQELLDAVNTVALPGGE